MYLKNDKIVVTIKNVVMRSSCITTKHFVLDPTAIIGWTDGTAARRDATPRATSNGDFSEKASMSSRLISLSGSAVGKDREELQELRDTFTGLLADGEYTQIAVETSIDTRYATVGLEGTPSWVQQSDTVAIWRLDLYAPDPYIYGVERSIHLGATTDVGGGLSYPLTYPINYNAQNQTAVNPYINNKGNVPAWPLFVVTGDYFSGFTITDGRDRKVSYTGSVSYYAPVVIDMAKGTATQSGVDKSIYVSERGWFAIQPNQSINPAFSPVQNASGWCDILIRDTYI